MGLPTQQEEAPSLVQVKAASEAFCGAELRSFVLGDGGVLALTLRLVRHSLAVRYGTYSYPRIYVCIYAYAYGMALTLRLV